MTRFRGFPLLLLTLPVVYVYADESAEAELTALDNAWIEAEVTGDEAALERILHEDFLVTYGSGRTVDRPTFIAGILKNRPGPFTVTHESIRVHDDTAVVIDVLENGEVKFTWIAVRRDGQWRVISETVSRIQSP